MAYSKIGLGVAGTGTGDGNGELWLGGHNQGVASCFKRVMADARCAKDFFTYVPRGDGNCGCKASHGALKIRGDNNADYYRIPGTPAKCETIKNNGKFCGDYREYNPKTASAFCMSSKCNENSESDKKGCCVGALSLHTKHEFVCLFVWLIICL